MAKKTIYSAESKSDLRRVDVHSSEDENEESAHKNVAAHRRALQKYESKKEFIYPVERIAQDKLMIRNVKFPGADEAYPDITQALMRFISIVYPNAKGGPLYVDEPKNEKEVYRAYERQKITHKLGLRHIVVEKDSTYEHLLEQLGEF